MLESKQEKSIGKKYIFLFTLLIFLSSCKKLPACEIIDYDFYLADDTLYAFALEGESIIKHNDLIDLDYHCANNFKVFKKSFNGNEYSKEEISDKFKRREVFAGEGIEKLLLTMDEVYSKDFSKVNPWTISAAQLDCDEKIEVFVGAYRATDFYEDDPRPYFFEYEDGSLIRQWTGSYLDNQGFSSAYFIDEDYDGISTLLVDEIFLEGETVIRKKGEFSISGFLPYRIREVETK